MGSEDAICKQLYALAFTKTWANSEIEDSSKFTPRVLLGTSGCVGTGVDCDDVHLMLRLGMPTSVLHLIQEMGRCGRKRRNALELGGMNDNCYHVMHALQDFVYLTERLHMNEITQESDADNEEGIEGNNIMLEEEEEQVAIMSKEEERVLLRQNLERCLSLFSLENGCWHAILEKESGNPFLLTESLQNDTASDCHGHCPSCDGTMELLIKPVVRTGLMSFLASAFGDMCSGQVTPIQLAKQLFEFKDVGTIAYKRAKSKNAESLKVTQLTIIQLIAACIIKLEVDVSGKKPIAHCKLCFDKSNHNSPTYMQPHYTIDIYWNKIKCM